MPLKRVRIGSRSDNRVFNFGGQWSPDEIERVTAQLKAVFKTFGAWTEAAMEIAESLKERVPLVPMPKSMIREASLLPASLHPLSLEQGLRHSLPQINWQVLPVDPHTLATYRSEKLKDLQRSADEIAVIDNRPNVEVVPSNGTLHEAMRKYEDYVKIDQPSNFDRHSKIKQLIDRSTDIPLASLDITRCRDLIDYWRNRPARKDGKGDYSAKRSREQLAELDLFFEHTHASKDFGWRLPVDYQMLSRTIKKDEKKTLSFIEKQLFEADELKKLVGTGNTVQRLITTWCLNCAHGAAEIGRVTWGDLYLNQDHPWRSQGLKIESGGNWTGFLRYKTDVVGWWLLWPETVALLAEWKTESEQILAREVKADDRLIICESGESMYKDKSKNAQSKFAKVFEKVVEKAGIQKLPLGILRNQLPDFITTHEGDAVAASVALAHGIPHKADKLLFAHYSNRPWKRLFEYQSKYREVIFGEKRSEHEA
jgi:hypothetical protein